MEKIAEKLKRYAELKLEEKRISSELDELKPAIKEHLLGHDIDKLPTNYGTFTIMERNTWEFSDAVARLQKAEKANGTAKAVKAVVLLFKEVKKDD